MLKKIKKSVTALFCIFSMLVYTTPCYADTLSVEIGKATVTDLKKGEAAPFEGVLLSRTAAAKLYGQLNFFEEECKLQLSKELDITKIKYNAEIDALKLKLDVETIRTEKLLAIKNERIEFLEQNWQPPAWYESGEFWLAVGIVSGVLITAAAGHALNSAN